MAKANETQVPTETEQNNLKIFDEVSNSVNISHKNCSYCNKPFTEELWCKECDPFRMIEGWTSGNDDIDKFIKDTIYDTRNANEEYEVMFLEWVPFDRFKDINQIGVGGFAKVYSATWIDGKAEYTRQDDEWKKTESQPIKVALKRLNGSENMSVEYLNENLAYKCMNANSNQRPTASELDDILSFWYFSSRGDKEYPEVEKFGYKGKVIRAIFEEADKEIPNISTSYEKNPDAIYTSRLFTFNNLTKPINSSLITSYLDDEENNKDCQDSQLFDLEVASSLQLKDDASNE
ncbi:kinase-like domain-containing protein [Rhizophagus irregularis DAOM 181602=DAOM 197198]|nr:kinase-like domain-containing protein [Rhizophagus irregularis DAOM 181602=DAOM 197198]